MALIDYLKAWPQYLMPGHLLSRCMHALTRVRYRPFKNTFIDVFARLYRVDMSEAAQPDPHAYEHFNAFFTRALRPGIRPVVSGEDEVACPVDGSVSQVGRITQGRIFQAKGHDFSLEQLVGSRECASLFQGGDFATLYLSPQNYHRIHMPVDGRLTQMLHIPGRLFSVSPSTTQVIPGLFARNERVVCLFETELGPMAVILVGAVFVGSIETVWAGEITPLAGRLLRLWHYHDPQQRVELRRGDELGRFNMGSTVILLFGPGAVDWADGLTACQPVVMGQRLAKARGKG